MTKNTYLQFLYLFLS